jgi:hypothetical protein
MNRSARSAKDKATLFNSYVSSVFRYSFQIAPSIWELFNHSCTLVRSHLNGNLPMLHLSTRKIVKNQQKIIDLFLWFTSLERGTWRVFQTL